MSLESVNIDILSSIIIYLELSDVRHLVLSSSSLYRVICNANFIWRNLLRRDFSILIPHDQPNLIYDIYKDTFKNSYNLYLRTNAPLTWKEYTKDKTITLNVEIGEGLPSKKLPLPPHKILKGYNSVVVHEFILKEKIGKVEKVIMKKALKVFATKIFDGKYLFNEHKDPSKNDQPYPIQFHFVDNSIYFAYFYNATIVCPTDMKLDIDMYTGYGEAENCIDAFKKNFQRGYIDNPEGKKDMKDICENVMCTSFLLHGAYLEHKQNPNQDYHTTFKTKHIPPKHYAFMEKSPEREIPATFKSNKTKNNFQLPYSSDTLCDRHIWRVVCFFGLIVDADWEWWKPDGCFCDWNVRYVPNIQKLIWNNMSFYPLSGPPGCISLDLPEPISNLWSKHSVWNRYLMKNDILVLLKEFANKAPDNSFEGLTQNDFDNIEARLGHHAIFDDGSTTSTETSSSTGTSSGLDSSDSSSEIMNSVYENGQVDEELELKILSIQEMGFEAPRNVIIQNLAIDGTIETAIAAIISQIGDVNLSEFVIDKMLGVRESYF